MKTSTSTVSERLTPLLISSDLFQGRERFDAWRDEVSLRVLRVDLDAPDKNNFRREVRVLRLPNVTIMDRTTTSGSVTRTPALVRDGDDSLLFTFCWEGALDARFRKGHVQLTTGEGALVSSDMVGGLFALSDCKSSTLRVSRETGRSLTSSVDDLFFRATRSDDPSLTILKAYLSSLQATSNGLSESMATLADRQIRELLAHIVNPAGDLSRSETYGGLRAARLQAILREVAVRIADPGLNAEGVGRRLGVSGRYVQQLLEGGDTHFPRMCASCDWNAPAKYCAILLRGTDASAIFRRWRDSAIYRISIARFELVTAKRRQTRGAQSRKIPLEFASPHRKAVVLAGAYPTSEQLGRAPSCCKV
jgi:hypothetical protein